MSCIFKVEGKKCGVSVFDSTTMCKYHDDYVKEFVKRNVEHIRSLEDENQKLKTENGNLRSHVALLKDNLGKMIKLAEEKMERERVLSDKLAEVKPHLENMINLVKKKSGIINGLNEKIRHLERK